MTVVLLLFAHQLIALLPSVPVDPGAGAGRQCWASETGFCRGIRTGGAQCDVNSVAKETVDCGTARSQTSLDAPGPENMSALLRGIRSSSAHSP